MSDRSPPPIEFFFGFRSPYRYLAQTRLPGQGEAEAFEPMDLLPVVKTMGTLMRGPRLKASEGAE